MGHLYFYYRLKPDHSTEPIAPSDEVLREVAEALAAFKLRRVGATRVGGTYISTMFLVMNHQFDTTGPPVLFETMVSGDKSRYCRRYSTWQEAEAGHAEEVQKAREGSSFARRIWRWWAEQVRLTITGRR